jgi:hypothetical protein
VLITRLPQESWTQTALRDAPVTDLAVELVPDKPQFGPWALDNYQLARISDGLQLLVHLTSLANGGTPPPFLPAPVPGRDRPQRKQSVAAVTYLSSLRAREGA